MQQKQRSEQKRGRHVGLLSSRAVREVVTNAVEFAGNRGDSRIGTEPLLAKVTATSSPYSKEPCARPSP